MLRKRCYTVGQSSIKIWQSIKKDLQLMIVRPHAALRVNEISGVSN